MRRLAGLAALAAIAGCNWDLDRRAEDWRLRERGLNREDVENPLPTRSEIVARVTNDVRENRMLAWQLESGRPACDGIVTEEGKTLCAKDKSELMLISLRSDPSERQWPVEETAFYCPTEAFYYYHYVGGRHNQDVWMGPFGTGLRPLPKP